MEGSPGAGGGPGHGGASLPVSRSFVVQLTSDAAPAGGRVRGRVEHIDSGRARRFDSLDQLMSFISEVLEDAEAGD